MTYNEGFDVKKETDKMMRRHTLSDLDGHVNSCKKLGYVYLGLSVVIGLIYGLPYFLFSVIEALTILSFYHYIQKKKAYQLIYIVLLIYNLMILSELLLFGLPEITNIDDAYFYNKLPVFFGFIFGPTSYLIYKIPVTLFMLHGVSLKSRYRSSEK
ncbi:MAG: hypothetical protein AAFQ94_26325 [Bacteroidota bacterium]